MYGFMPLYRLRTLRPCVHLQPCPVPCLPCLPRCEVPRYEVPRHVVPRYEFPKRKEAPYVHGLG
jgi:hypothetical protein